MHGSGNIFPHFLSDGVVLGGIMARCDVSFFERAFDEDTAL